MVRLTVTDKIRNLFAHKGRIDAHDIPITPQIENCPICSSRIELVDELWRCTSFRHPHREEVPVCGAIITPPAEPRGYQPYPCKSDVERVIEMHYVCVGCETRADVERFLAPDLPNKEAPEALESTPPCGWAGKVTDFGKRWL